MSKLLKQLFSSFVTLTTIFWSVGIGSMVLPAAAHAATLTPGGLIKASGPAVYYYAGDQKRYVFPNEKTYFSWYADFSTVQTISDADLAAVAIGGNVTIRPGTRLVKITTDPKVYAVTRCGVLHWVQSEADAIALWGANWAQSVVDVPDGFFVNYTTGSPVVSGVHPDGTLIAYATSSDRYVVWNGQRRHIIGDAAFSVNRFNSANVVQTAIAYPSGADVTAYESTLSDTVCAGSAPVVSGTLAVALASDTPAGVTVPKNAASVGMAKFNFTAGASDVTLTGLRAHRLGVGATTDFSNVYLYDTNGNRLTTGLTVNSSNNIVEFNGLNFTVQAGTTKSIVLQGDYSGPSTAGGQHAFEIVDAGSVIIGGSSSTVTGSFPIRGNVFTVGNALSGRLDVQKGTTPTNPNIGAMDAEISNFKLTANTNDIEVRRITVLQAGTITNTDLSNLVLYVGTQAVASTPALNNDKMVFNFTTPYLLPNGTTKTFSLHSKIGGRAGRTIKTYVEYTTDVYAVDKFYNSGAAVCIAATATGGCTAGGQGSFNGTTNGLTGSSEVDYFTQVTTQGGALTISFNGPPAQNVSRGSNGVVMFRFSMASPDNSLEVRNLSTTLQGVSGSMIQGTAGTQYFRNIRIKNLDTGATLMGPLSLPSGTANGATSAVISFSQPFTIPQGQIYNLGVVVDTANTEDVTNQFFGSGTSTYNVVLGTGSAILNQGDVRVVSTGEQLDITKVVPNTPITGNNQTIKSSSLDISLSAGIASATVVKKQANIPSAGFVLTAGGQSDVLITAVKLTGSGSYTTAGTFTLADMKSVVTSCGLYDGNTSVGVSQAPDATLATMNITNMNLLIPRGTSKVLTAKCTVGSVVNLTAGNQYAVGIAAAGDVTAQDQNSNTVTPTLSSSVVSNAALTGQTVIITQRSAGTLSLTTDNLRQSTILVAGGDVWQNFAQFRATAQYEDIVMNRLNVTSTGHSSNFSQIAVVLNGTVVGSDVLPSGFLQKKDIDLSGSPVTVPNNSAITFQLWGKLANVQASSSVNGATTVARSGNQVSLGVGSNLTTGEWDSNYNDKYNIRALGAASGDRIYATSSNMTGGTTGNTFVTRKTKPVVVRQPLSTTVLSSGLDTDLYKFQVAANDTVNSLTLKKVEFNFSKSTTTGSGLTLSNFRLRRNGSDINLAGIRIVDQNGNDLTGTFSSNGWIMASSSGQIIVSFINGTEDTISGSGNVYTLHALIGGTILTGDSVSLSFRRNGGSTPSTGYLTGDFVTSTLSIPGPHIDTGTTPSNTASIEGTFLWSDLSEIPHSPTQGSLNGSRDWTDDVFLDDLTPTQVLSK